MEALLNETQVAENLQVSLACLRRWRMHGIGPEYIKVGPLVRYRPEAIANWIDELPTGGNGRRPIVRTDSGRERSAFHSGQEIATPTKAGYIRADQFCLPHLFACNTAADHTFRVANHTNSATSHISKGAF
jgi:hypothetical protein